MTKESLATTSQALQLALSGKKQGASVQNDIHNIMHALLRATPDGLLICNQEGDIIFVNAATEIIFGYNADELLGQKIEILMPAKNVQQHAQYRHHYFAHPIVRPMGVGRPLYGQHKDKHVFPVEISLSPIETEDGVIVLATIRDITERKHSEDAKSMLLSVIESSDEAIIGIDLSGTIFSWNNAAETLYGYSEAQMLGSCIKKLYTPQNVSSFDAIMKKIMRGEHLLHQEIDQVHQDGHIIPVSMTLAPMKNVQGEVIGASTTAHDITEQKRVEEKLKHLAEHDPLTGLINRALFDDRMEQAIVRSKRLNQSMAVCFLDFDDFKMINDQYGHTTGDYVLQEAAARLRQCIRESDTLARIGGDEFALILFDIKKETDVVEIATHMMKRVAEGMVIDNKTLNVTLSIGIAIFPRDGEDELIEKADAAMYAVKKQGKNNFQWWASLTLGS